MHLPKALLGLPASLLLLVTAQIQAQELPPAHLPTAIKKMSPDSGEKLLREHYAFAPLHGAAAAAAAPPPLLLGARSPGNEQLAEMGNSSSSSPGGAAQFSRPFVVHYHHDPPSPPPRRRRSDSDEEAKREVLDRLRGRAFSCPPDTRACADIGMPNYCCAKGTTCYEVEGAPESGNVGCCPEGRGCEGSGVGSCSGDATACSAEVGGGCCIAGFVCAQIGCKVSSNPLTPHHKNLSMLVLRRRLTWGWKIGVASSISVITQTTTISNSPTTVIATVIVTVTPTYTREPETSTVTRTTTAGPTTSDTGAIPPVRPTSSNEDEPEPSSTTEPPEYCPTGFYACEASAGAGCCRTGRDCATTSCPPPSEYTTITNGDGVTVVAPVPTGTDAGDDQPEPECASGWSLCPAEAGPIAGCCPDGYRCGTASCTLSEPDATATAQKQFPNAAGESRWAGSKGDMRWASALLVCAAVGFAGVI